MNCTWVDLFHVCVCVWECVSCWFLLFYPSCAWEELSGMYQAAFRQRELSLCQWHRISSHLFNLVKNFGKQGVVMPCHLSSHSTAFSPLFRFALNISMAILFLLLLLLLLAVHPFAHRMAALLHSEGAHCLAQLHSCVWLHTSSPSHPLQPLLLQLHPPPQRRKRGRAGKNETRSISAVLGQLLLVDSVLSGQASILLLFWSLPLLWVTGQSKRKWRAAGWLELHLPTQFLFLFSCLFWPTLCRSCQLRASGSVNYSELFS